MVIYMSEQNPDWSDTMEGQVVNFIIHTDTVLHTSQSAFYSYLTLICWSCMQYVTFVAIPNTAVES